MTNKITLALIAGLSIVSSAMAATNVERFDRVLSIDPRTGAKRVGTVRETFREPSSGIVLARVRYDNGLITVAPISRLYKSKFNKRIKPDSYRPHLSTIRINEFDRLEDITVREVFENGDVRIGGIGSMNFVHESTLSSEVEGCFKGMQAGDRVLKLRSNSNGRQKAFYGTIKRVYDNGVAIVQGDGLFEKEIATEMENLIPGGKSVCAQPQPRMERQEPTKATAAREKEIPADEPSEESPAPASAQSVGSSR